MSLSHICIHAFFSLSLLRLFLSGRRGATLPKLTCDQAPPETAVQLQRHNALPGAMRWESLDAVKFSSALESAFRALQWSSIHQRENCLPGLRISSEEACVCVYVLEIIPRERESMLYIRITVASLNIHNTWRLHDHHAQVWFPSYLCAASTAVEEAGG